MQIPRKKSRRIEVFDGMRGMAAVIVMVFHLIVMTKTGHASNHSLSFENGWWRAFTVTPLKLLWAGNEAVILFYIIGGFVIAKPYLEGRELQFGNFIKKRFSRLILPYWLILSVTVIFIGLFMGLKDGIQLSSSFNVKWSEFPSGMDILAQLLAFDYNMDITAGAFWSIVQEWRIALFIPFIGLWLAKSSTKQVVAIVLLGNWSLDAITLEMLGSSNEVLAYVGDTLNRTNYYFIFFFIGAVLCKHIEELREFFAKRKWVRIISGLSLPILIPYQWVLAGFGVTIGRREAMPITAIGIVLLLLVAMESEWLSKFFKSKPLLFLGEISFSLYLTHTTAIVLFVTLLGQVMDPQWAMIISPVFALGFAVFWYKHVEQRLAGFSLPKVWVGSTE